MKGKWSTKRAKESPASPSHRSRTLAALAGLQTATDFIPVEPYSQFTHAGLDGVSNESRPAWPYTI